MEIPKEFFTLQSMLTLTGATGTVFVISNGLQSAFNFNPRWLALLIAQGIALLGVRLSGGSGWDYFVGVVNGFLIFSTAAGATSIGGSSGAAAQRGDAPRTAQDARRVEVSPADGKRRFSSGWF